MTAGTHFWSFEHRDHAVLASAGWMGAVISLAMVYPTL